MFGRFLPQLFFFFFFNDTATTEIYTLSLHDALPISGFAEQGIRRAGQGNRPRDQGIRRSEEHTSELQSPCNLVCRLLLEKKKKKRSRSTVYRYYRSWRVLHTTSHVGSPPPC